MAVVTVEVGTRPVRLLTRNPDREFYAVINTSGVDVYIGHDSNVSTTGKSKGILLKAEGGMWGDEYHKGEVWAVAEASTEVTIIEV